MHVLIITIGSAGDVHPFLGLGVELKRRGHPVTFFTGDYFEAEARKAGLDFVSMFSTEEFTHVMEHPDLWDPIKGFRLLYRDIFMPLLPVVYKFVADRYVSGETGVVTSTLGFGARVAQEKLGVPTVTVHLQPAVFRSLYDTPVYPGVRMGPRMPRWLKRLMFRWVDRVIDSYIASPLNAFRAPLGLKPARRIFDGWFNSPECVLGLFPDWFAPPQPDWPSRTSLTGFPLYDGAAVEPAGADVRRFLDEGEAPVVFTAGSAMKQGRWFFEAAVDACQRLNCRGLLINRFRDQLPESLPSHVLHAEYAPFSQVFSRARVVVHHGGIGTTGQVLAAGVPQLIVPLAFDQPDQAMRVERLGVGLQIARDRFQGKSVAEKVRQILENPRMAERARDLAGRISGPAAVTAACDVIEQSFRHSVLSS